jgi:hypothetical protein
MWGRLFIEHRMKVLAISAMIVSVAGCSSSPSTSGQSPSPSAMSPTSEATSTFATASSATASESPSATTDVTSDTETPASENSGAVVLGPSRGGATLVLADFFQPTSEWSEGSYDLADRKGIEGISAEVSTCYSDNANFLELRLADNFKTLTFEAAQSNDSKSSDQTLTIAVQANGRQVTAKNIPFNKVQDFSVSVAGVNSLRLLFYLSTQPSSNCRGSVNAVIFKTVVS